MNATCIKTTSKVLSRRESIDMLSKAMPGKSGSTYIMKLYQMTREGSLVHVGRDAYQFPEHASLYAHEYSSAARKVAAFMEAHYPLVKFRILEFVQYNEFVNHLLGHNIILLSVEKDVMSFIFDDLQEQAPSKVLLHPSVDDFHIYWQDDTIVVEPLLTEAPRSSQGKWQTSLEKLLVDLIADKYLKSSISESEYQLVYETAFERYTVDTRKLFRYARRRNAAQKIRKIMEGTDIIMTKTEKPC